MNGWEHNYTFNLKNVSNQLLFSHEKRILAKHKRPQISTCGLSQKTD